MNKKICYQACLFLFMFFMGVQEIYSQKDAKEWNKLPIKALLLAPPEPGQVESFVILSKTLCLKKELIPWLFDLNIDINLSLIRNWQIHWLCLKVK